MPEAAPPRRCPALFVSAPASGQGKTTVTAALARLHARAGRRVRVFKTGQDFLDPMILEAAAGAPCYQLDLYMGGEAHCRQLLYQAAGEAELILIEGAMGLFDGEPSSADLAERFGVPVLAVIDAAAMAQSFAALAFGLARFRPSVPFAGVAANGVAGDYHRRLLAQQLPEDLPLLASLPHAPDLALPERHLGLARASELADLHTRLERAADALAGSALAELPASVAFTPADDEAAVSATGTSPARPLAGVHIAVARDAAFCFAYPANLDLLRAQGAELAYFSPLAGDPLPAADSLYLPGGYPELHLCELAGNRSLAEQIRAHHAAGKPILAECGGMLYLLEALSDSDGRRAPMVGLLPGEARLQQRLAAIGLQELELPEGRLRGQSFHYSTLTTPLAPLARGRCPNGGPTAEPVYRLGRLTASYLHLYFPSNPQAAARLLLS